MVHLRKLIKIKHTLIFDIGKTNKKYYLFDEDFNVVTSKEEVFIEIEDEDGFACDSLSEIKRFVFLNYGLLQQNPDYNIDKLNFSTYGASLVHVNKLGLTDLPLYNYLKPMDSKVMEAFYEEFDKEKVALETSSPPLGMLNSGFQLLWLKKHRPLFFKDIVHSLHLPNYLAYLFHDLPVADYTSIGCHTALWNFKKRMYHEWTATELMLYLFKRPIDSTTIFISPYGQKVGVGIHDSSAALLPYLVGSKAPFLLISTGTWSISLNPFNQEPLTMEELNQDCLEFLSVNGDKVKASRLFLGQEFSIQVELLNKLFGFSNGHFKTVSFDESLYQKVKQDNAKYYKFSVLGEKELRNKNLKDIKDFEWAYHQLIWELVQHQMKAIELAIGETQGIKTIFIDGGFAKNDVFCQMLKNELPAYQWKKTNLAAGSALGAAIAVNMESFTEKHFNRILQVENV